MNSEVEVRREASTCANCGAAMLGDYCPACGQARKSPLRHLPALAADAADTVLSLDGRLMHTVPALFLRPGFLSKEYFAGRRVRYIPPFRLAFLLCLLAMFVSHLAIDSTTNLASWKVNGAFDELNTAAAVQRNLDEQLQGLTEARLAPGLPAVARAGLDKAEAELREAAKARLLALDANPNQPAAAASSTEIVGTASVALPGDKPPILNVDADNANLSLGPIRWLPDFANARLKIAETRIKANLAALESSDQATKRAAINRMLTGGFSALPPAMFLMLPVFAVLLKVLYVFKRRLYVEHLIVALHSHAFLFLSVLLLAGLAILGHASTAHAWLQTSFGWMQTILCGWMLLYLLLMQKRVYAQGWTLTSLKFLLAGFCYVVLLSFVITAAFLIGISAS